MPSKEELEMFKAIDKLFEEYDVRISPRGGMSKKSKPEYAEKHRKELQEFAKKCSHLIERR